jgi:hypothetical protein
VKRIEDALEPSDCESRAMRMATPRSKGVSRPCEQCNTVKRCAMFIDETTRKPIYLCPACARDLGYARKATE